MNLQMLTPEVLRLVGRKAVAPLGIMAAVGGAIYYLTGELEQDIVQLRFAIDATSFEIQETNDRIATIDQELGVIREKGRRYDQILLTGFTQPQNRLDANQLIDELSRRHDIVTLNYTFEPEAIVEHRGVHGVEFDVATTEVGIEMQAYADYNLMGFAAEFIHRLDGQVQVDSFTIQRNEMITPDLMERIASGGVTGVFVGTLRLNWNNVTARHADDGQQDDGG